MNAPLVEAVADALEPPDDVDRGVGNAHLRVVLDGEARARASRICRRACASLDELVLLQIQAKQRDPAMRRQPEARAADAAAGVEHPLASGEPDCIRAHFGHSPLGSVMTCRPASGRDPQPSDGGFAARCGAGERPHTSPQQRG